MVRVCLPPRYWGTPASSRDGVATSDCDGAGDQGLSVTTVRGIGAYLKVCAGGVSGHQAHGSPATHTQARAPNPLSPLFPPKPPARPAPCGPIIYLLSRRHEDLPSGRQPEGRPPEPRPRLLPSSPPHLDLGAPGRPSGSSLKREGPRTWGETHGQSSPSRPPRAPRHG